VELMPSKKLLPIVMTVATIFVGAMLMTGCSTSVDQKGGTRIILQALPVSAQVATITPEDMGKLEKVIKSRANAITWDSVVKRAEHNRLIIELPGISNTQELKDSISATSLLEFKELASTPYGVPFWKDTALNGYDLKKVEATPNVDGTWHVNFEFTENGTIKFAALTKRLVGQQIGVFIDGVPTERGTDGQPLSIKDYHGITVREPIVGSSGEISGSFSKEQAVDLAIKLNSGALPVPVKILEIQAVKPRQKD
jgi:preprotein translocase subunit SecD